MAIERVGYRRLYDAIDCSISGLGEIRVAFPFEDRFHIEIYIGPTPRFGMCTEKNDDYYAHPGTETNKNISYHFDVTQSSHPRRFFTEISCFRDIEVSPALSQAFHHQDQQEELLAFLDTFVTNQNPSVMSRFKTLAKQANMPTQKADIEAFRRFKEMRNSLVHRGENTIQLVVSHPEISWRKPLEPNWFRPRLTVSS